MKENNNNKIILYVNQYTIGCCYTNKKDYFHLIHKGDIYTFSKNHMSKNNFK